MITPDLARAMWTKSSFSGNGADCVEVACGATWLKSSFSGNGMSCVEIAHSDTWTAMRDSKNPEGPPLVFDAAAMATFLQGVKTGEFDLT